jgi:predicted ribosome quality control (RQC) complex YloA/Tae2 family protein
VSLDPQLTVVENANARFTRYHKMRRAAQQIPEQITRTETDLARVAQLLTDLDLADNLTDLTHVRGEITAARLGMTGRVDARKPGNGAKARGNLKGKGPTKTRAGGEPLRFTSAEGFTIWVGKNSQQNEHVTFDIATGNDLWMHARGVPGAHVIVKCGGRPASPATLAAAASLAAWYSASRTAGSVPVDYTEQRYVRHMKDGGPGMVIYVREKTIPAIPRELPTTVTSLSKR